MASNARNLANLLGTGQSTISAEKLGSDVPPGTEDYSSVDSLGVGTTIGETAFVEGSNRLYIWNGSGWYNIALINTTPTWDSGGQPAVSYELDADSPQSSTTVTLAASDPEGLPISYNYITGGSMDSIATISQDSSVFTITPKTSTQAPDGGTGSITFRATDGINILPQVSSFTLNFISIIENSRYTTLLATATGTSDNNNITDSSSSNHSITVNGDAHAGTFSPYRNRGYSTYFEDTAANVLYASSSSDFAFGTGAFTISVWVKILHSFGGTIFDTNDGSNVGATMEISGTNFSVHSGTSYTQLASISSSNQDVWQHFCWTRDGSGNNKIFVNGTQSTTFTNSTNYTSQNFKMGERQNGAQDLKAYIKDLHIVKGYANEPDSTYADGAAEAGTGTVFLGCSLPYHGDKSSSPKTLTVASSGISIVNDTPHNYLEYSATDHGGSVVFDSTGDSITFSEVDFGTGDFFIEGWFNRSSSVDGTAVSGGGGDASVNQGLVRFGKDSANAITMYLNNAYVFRGVHVGEEIAVGYWFHYVVSRSGTTIRAFVNGKLITTGSSSEDIGCSAVGFQHGNNGNFFNGYVSDLRVSTSIPTEYQTSSTTAGSSIFTPPTAPQSSSGTSLHIKGTDASIIDKSQSRNIKITSNITSTTQTKFANTRSIYFGGSTSVNLKETLIFPTTNTPFTGELWFYPTNVAGGGQIIGQADAPNGGRLGLHLGTDGRIRLYWQGANDLYSTNSISDNQWHHIAFVRKNNGYLAVYVNGTETELAQDNNNRSIDGSLTRIGSNGPSYFPSYIQGYIQDVRFTNGLARYTANFTPPTASLEG